MEIDWLVLSILFVTVVLIGGVAIGRGWIRPVGFIPGRPSSTGVGIVLLATTFVAVLVGVAYSPFGSAALSAGL